MSDLQQLISRTSADATDSRFTHIEKTLNEISNMVITYQISATYDPNNPRKQQDFTQFCIYCEKSGHTINFCGSLRKRNLMRKKRLLNRKKLVLKITPADQNQQTPNDRTQMMALTHKEVIATVHTYQTAFVAEVKVTLELFALKQDLTRFFILWHIAVMQSFKLSKSPNQECEEENDTPQSSRAGMPGQHFLIELFQYAVGDRNENIGLSTQLLIDTGATCSIINCDTFTEIEKLQPLLVMLLDKSLLAANGQTTPMKEKVLIQSGFDTEFSCVIEHTVSVSDSPEARMNIEKDFFCSFGEIIILRNAMLISTVFPGKCVNWSPYLDKPFPYVSKLNFVELSQDLMIEPYSTRVLTLIAKDEDKHLFRKGTNSRSHKTVLDIGSYTYHVYCSHDESKYPLMLDNSNTTSNTNKKGILCYTLLDCTQKTTQTMSVIDNVVFIDFVKALDSESNMDMHVCSTEP